MPRIRREAYANPFQVWSQTPETVEWRAANPTIVALFNRPDPDPDWPTHVTAAFSLYHHDGLLSELVTPVVVEWLRGRPESTPAMTEDCPSILNGTYRVGLGEETFDFRIYTVTSTPTNLMGNRIIKVLRDGQFRGFAFLTVNGGLRLYRSHAREWDLPYVRAARILLRSMPNLGHAPLVNNATEGASGARVVRGAAWCRRDNDVLDDVGYVSGLCRHCRDTEAATQRRAAGIAADREAQERRRREAEQAQQALTPVNAAIETYFRQMVSQEAPVPFRTQPIAMCAINGEEVR